MLTCPGNAAADDPDYADLAEQRTKYRLYLARKQLFKARTRGPARHPRSHVHAESHIQRPQSPTNAYK